MNQIENQAENLESKGQENATIASDEKQEQAVVNSTSTGEESVNGENQDDEKSDIVAREQGNSESEEGDDDSFEWTQKKSGGAGISNPSEKGEENESKSSEVIIADYQKKISALEAKVSEQENLLLQIQGVQEDPIIKTWAAHKERHGSDASPSLFLQELGQIKFVDSRSDEEKLKEYFTDLAKQAGVSDEHMEDAVQEDLDAYFSKTIRERQSLLKDAEKHLSKLEVRSVEDLEKDYKKQVDSMVSEGVNWAKTNYHLAEDFINKVVSKGKFNGKTVDRKWADKILEAFRESRAVLDPRYMVLADPDEKGNQFMYIPEMVELVDAIEFRKENVEFFKNQIKRGRAENLNERAEKAEQGRITKELQKETSSTKFDREWIEANKSFGLRVQN
jgi:hypothetical protein